MLVESKHTPEAQVAGETLAWVAAGILAGAYLAREYKSRHIKPDSSQKDKVLHTLASGAIFVGGVLAGATLGYGNFAVRYEENTGREFSPSETVMNFILKVKDRMSGWTRNNHEVDQTFRSAPSYKDEPPPNAGPSPHFSQEPETIVAPTRPTSRPEPASSGPQTITGQFDLKPDLEGIQAEVPTQTVFDRLSQDKKAELDPSESAEVIETILRGQVGELKKLNIHVSDFRNLQLGFDAKNRTLSASAELTAQGPGVNLKHKRVTTTIGNQYDESGNNPTGHLEVRQISGIGLAQDFAATVFSRGDKVHPYALKGINEKLSEPASDVHLEITDHKTLFVKLV